MLDIRELGFYYTNEVPIFEQFNFQLSAGEIVALLGKSGSGKSTLLKLIFGLYDWQKGEIHFNGRKLLGPKGNLVPGEPDIKWVAQEFDLMPYTTVAENVGAYFSNIDLQKKNQQIDELLEVVDMAEFKNTKVIQLSGGQKQRVALAKALAEVPQLLLLDEPFSQLDTFLTNRLQRKLFEYVALHKISVLFVTHHSTDALSFADRIDILDQGKIVESNHPETLFFHPQHKVTAELMGDINILPGKLIGSKEPSVFIHPFQIQKVDQGIPVTVVHSYFKGSYFLVECKLQNLPIYLQHPEALPKGEVIEVAFKWHRPM